MIQVLRDIQKYSVSVKLLRKDFVHLVKDGEEDPQVRSGESDSGYWPVLGLNNS